MDSIEILIPDKEGNHLVVALNFYDNIVKAASFQIPEEFRELDIADISITKLDVNRPLSIKAFFTMCDWLIEQFMMFPHSVFSFICSTDSLNTNHYDVAPEIYRWRLFELLYQRKIKKLHNLGIESRDIIVGPDGYRTFARVFYRISHAPIIHIVLEHLNSKFSV